MGSSRKLITVFGATGNQGRSVCQSLIQNPNFHVRAITRSPHSEASKKLLELGVEVVKGDGWDTEDMVHAFRGSSGAFVNINSFEPLLVEPNRPTEFELGRIIIDSAAKAGVENLVYSTGAPSSEMTRGKIQFDAFDKKYDTERYIRKSSLFKTASFIAPGWYLENFLDKDIASTFGGFPLSPDSEGYFTYHAPHFGGDGLVPWVDIENDFGDIVHGIFLDPERWNAKLIHGVSELLTFGDMTRAFENATGQKARFIPVLPSCEAWAIGADPQSQIPKKLISFTQFTEGRYFGPEVNETDSAAELKKVTVDALGRSDASLKTVAGWFRERFAA